MNSIYHFPNCGNTINHAHFQHCLDCESVNMFCDNNYMTCYSCGSDNTTHIIISGTDEEIETFKTSKNIKK